MRVSADNSRRLRSCFRLLWHVAVWTLLSLGLWFTTRVPTAAQSVVCGSADYDTCILTGSSMVGDIALGEHCLTEMGRRQCVDSAPLNECAATEVSLKCEQMSETCVDWQHGECRQTRFIYECLNEDDDMSPAHLEETRFGSIQEEIISYCADLEDRASREECTLERTDITEGAETRDINRKLVTRQWWREQRTYSCISETLIDNTCGPLESDPTCTLQGSSCLVEDEDGNCTDRQFHYRCGVPEDELATSCEPINVCVGDTCLDVHQEESTSFAHAAAWLNLMAEMQKDFSENPSDDPNDIVFFSGERLTCSKAPGRDCCSDSGILTALSPCSETSIYLAEKRNAAHTHYVGTSCSFKILGKCIKKRQHYCTYNTKFSRVFMEQFKIHAPEAWGETFDADCTGVNLEDVANVDVEAMDFSEVVGDIADNLTITVSEEIAQFFDDRWPNIADLAGQTFEDVAAE